MKKKFNLIKFSGWISIDLPESWEYDTEEDIINIYSQKKPKGVLQLSFYTRKDKNESEENIAVSHLNSFIKQFNIISNELDLSIIETPSHTIAGIIGSVDGAFIKLWVLVNFEKMIIGTYNSDKKTSELSTVDDIMYSINFE